MINKLCTDKTSGAERAPVEAVKQHPNSELPTHDLPTADHPPHDLDVVDEPRLDDASQTAIGRQLRAVYSEIVQQPVPDNFLRLLEELERKETRE